MGFHVLWTKTSGKSALRVTHSRTDMQGLYLPQETAIMGRSPCCHRACIPLGKTDNKEVKAANSWEVPRRKINPDKEQKTGMFCEAGGAGEEEALRRAKCRGEAICPPGAQSQTFHAHRPGPQKPRVGRQPTMESPANNCSFTDGPINE